MGSIIKSKCKNCGFKDEWLVGEDDLPLEGSECIFFSKKTEYIVRMKIKDTKKYADKKFCAFDIKNKDKYEWTKDFKISDLRCPKCHKKELKSSFLGET